MVIKTIVVTAAVAVALAGCGTSADGAARGAVDVVASTNVWADVARQVTAGTKVTVTSIISDPNADPHSYEASTRNELAVSEASLIIENGGGYDDFMTTLRDGSGAKGTVLDAVKIAGTTGNEHVWYDFPAVAKVADRIAGVLAAKDAPDARRFRSNAAAFTARLSALEAGEAELRAKSAGAGVAVTEPVPLYLLAACGLVDRTPAAFSDAVANGVDVPPRVLQQTLALFAKKQVRLLVYNAQTVGPQTQQVQQAARAHGIPVVPVTETLPAGDTYLTWMSHNLDAVRKALGDG